MRIINWNIERHGPASWQARSLIDEITGLSPDLICLTEAWERSLDALGGHALSARGVQWGEQADSERKVVLWSPAPWRDPEVVEDLEETGSAATGICDLDGIAVRIVGLCIPYHFASPSGMTPKAKPWHQHDLFLTKLKPHLDAWVRQGPVIVLGDFNRRIPRTWGPKASYALLEQAFENYDVITAGDLPWVSDRTIDHVAVSGRLETDAVAGLPAEVADGRTRSDHFGVLVDLRMSG